jgi:hypothetical protein
MADMMDRLRQAWAEQDTQSADPPPRTRHVAGMTPPLPKLPKHWSMTEARYCPPEAGDSPSPGYIREQREKKAKVHAMDHMKQIRKSDNKTTLKMLIDMHAKQGKLLDKICELEEEKELESVKILHVMTALHIKAADFEAEIHELKEENHELKMEKEELKEKLDDMSESLKEKELEHAKMLHVTTELLIKSADMEAEIRELKEENEELKQKLGIQSVLWEEEIHKLKEEKKELKQKLDLSFTCSVSGEIFEHPVVAQDGHTYERASIERWLTIRKTSPMTNEPMLHDTLTPNHTLKSAIASHK